jgi:hypothetical protein
MMNSQAVCVTPFRDQFKAAVVELTAGDITAEARGKTTAEAEANARLIAAAPELYEVLEVFAELPLSAGTSVSKMDAKILNARAALAKARGEAA